ncbi:UTP-glucose-1-phosphate uridylyltransferase [Bacillus licheniformis WX-02]|nr:UTP-glucose-1-phosphate uridylyltransferase [Bacillus licheniformis WX-02]
MKVKKAVIPAAGLGTRFLPATKAQPKEMLPIVDKPAIQYIVEEAVQLYPAKGAPRSRTCGVIGQAFHR